ncbi:hypothetical protein [Desertibacillus haloalkaliphilus]|uniref:hypothetical protein n=1 Tax=Desertibacillus haloalkaliphilus TaxID=1328930 RepID=UPI001C253D24|nr:hypothetical protein [Desertibacillus haloalkaliphilus]MBU8905566.1 hypothetical protein [Desertibacillus haloalkaliphilus]
MMTNETLSIINDFIIDQLDPLDQELISEVTADLEPIELFNELVATVSEAHEVTKAFRVLDKAL